MTKELVEKWAFEIIIFLSIGFFTVIGKLINYFFKSNISDKMNELRKSLNEVRIVTDSLKSVTDNTVNNIKSIIEKIGELMISLDNFTDTMDEKFKALDSKITRLEDKVDQHGESIAKIKTTHNLTHRNNKLT